MVGDVEGDERCEVQWRWRCEKIEQERRWWSWSWMV